MSRQVRFDVTDEKWGQLQAHVSHSGRWKTVSDYARFCVFKEAESRPPGAHHLTTGKPPGRPRKPKVDKVPVETGGNPVPRLLEASGGTL